MSEWARKVFWSRVEVIAQSGGFGVTLDGRPVKTPAKAPLILPSRALADWVAVEWAAQSGKVQPATMPATQMANLALDKLPQHGPEVVRLLAAYGETDLLCHRAPGPMELVARQAADWDPLLDWAADALGARLGVGTGVMPVAQDAAALAALTGKVAALTPFRLAPFHDLVSISGSLVLALAVTESRLPPESAWAMSRIDEDWQAELWGADEEAQIAAENKRAAFLRAARFFLLADQAFA